MNKVSCITVTKNRVSFLPKCIKYFLEQTHENKELVIVYYNTDIETQEFLVSQKEELNNNNIFFYRFIEDEGLHLGAIRNYAISKANGDWLCIWDDDDYFSPIRIETQLQFCIDKDLIGCALTSIMVFSLRRSEIRVSVNRWTGWEGSLLVRKDSIPKYKNLPKGEDTPVLEMLLDTGNYDIFFNPELYVYYLHDNNISGDDHLEKIFERSLPLNVQKNREFKKLMR